MVRLADGEPVMTGIATTASAQTKALLQPGDRILAIDGHNATGDPIAVVAALLAGTPGSHKRLTLRRNDQLVKVDVPATKLL